MLKESWAHRLLSWCWSSRKAEDTCPHICSLRSTRSSCPWPAAACSHPAVPLDCSSPFNLSFAVNLGRLTQLCPSILFKSIQRLICHTELYSEQSGGEHTKRCVIVTKQSVARPTTEKFKPKEYKLWVSLSYVILLFKPCNKENA